MADQPALKYHQAIFDFLGLTPVISPGAQAVIAQREQACGITFPASVKEWFSIEGVHEIFEEYTTPDFLVDFEELGKPEEIAQGYLCVAYENQAVVLWFVRLDGSDDPPVYNDQNEYYGKGFSEIDWELTTDTFSEFIYGILSFDPDEA